MSSMMGDPWMKRSGPPKGALLTMRREEELGFNSTNFSAVIIALYQLMRINQRGLWGKTFET
jgi:hypothetical protein